MRSLFRNIAACLFGILSVAANAKQQLEPLNSTLIAKLHLDHNPGRSQMVGAYQIAFRPVGGGYINALTVLLNPGLRIEKVVGAGNRNLVYRSSVSPIENFGNLELRVAEIELAPMLQGTNRAEITIHYRGNLESLQTYGLNGVSDTLNPDFTMLRAKAFAYPVFAKANKADIEETWASSQFTQVAFIEYPGTNGIAGSLSVAGKTLSGDKTNYELKAAKRSNLMSVAIAPFTAIESGPISIAYLDGSGAGAESISKQLNQQYETYKKRLGTPSKGAQLQVIEVPSGTSTLMSSTATFIEGPITDATPITGNMRANIAGFWRINNRLRANHWADGLDQVTEAALLGDLPALSEQLFTQMKAEVKANKTLGKTPIEDFLTEGLEDKQAATSALAFAVLYQILGEQDFFAVVRAIRTEAATGYADMAAVAEVLNKNIKNKKARKFAKGWFSGKKLGNALSKATSFDALVDQQS